MRLNSLCVKPVQTAMSYGGSGHVYSSVFVAMLKNLVLFTDRRESIFASIVILKPATLYEGTKNCSYIVKIETV